MTAKHFALAILSFAFIACSGDSTLTYGNQTYKTVKIGKQVWMAENLNYEAEGSLCYDNNPDNCAKYGRLYNWQTAKKVCPAGWHLPSNEEWDKLYRFIDGDKGTESPYESPTAGKYLKAVSGWNPYKESDGNGTNAYGFSALPGGYGNPDGTFDDAGLVGNWWSTSEHDSSFAYFRDIYYDNECASRYYDHESSLFSVRCLKD